ncbi:MAG: transport permease protein [Gammaproteobacteria bacterium]|nr:MAG: ABC transporter permease [Pseudomonadota bacterium]MBC6945764.1 ABC transporter permease [Gammaproteobacteria bacterium]MCE7896765.1 ABC transporter permease [Gammaproteobacteria bacterium PRO8]MDL1881466.1 ABC transporter permease [Gammaproteobacteria bacterium PRO2]MCQ3935372.1 ABC transporter permease [Gammaproteobacteria bacterium]
MSAAAEFFQRVAAVAGKEVRQLRRDRLTAGMIFGVPLLLILIFGYGINFDVRHLRAAWADDANSSGSRALVADIAASQVVDFVARARGPEELRRLIASGEVSVGLYLPPDFERRRLGGERALAQLFIDGSEPGVEAAARALAGIPVRDRLTAPLRRTATLEVLTEYNPERRTAVQIVPALIGVILTMTMVVFTAIALVRERERGNLELLITTPVRPVELMLGKLLPYVAVGLVQTSIVLGAGVLLFQVPVNGSVAQLYAGATLFIAATLALGLLISTVARTQFQAMQLGYFVMLPSILLSGFMFPFEGMPVAVQWLAQALPLTHFNDILRGVILRGASLGDMSRPLLKLTAFFVVAVAVAAMRFRKRLG